MSGYVGRVAWLFFLGPRTHATSGIDSWIYPLCLEPAYFVYGAVTREKGRKIELKQFCKQGYSNRRLSSIGTVGIPGRLQESMPLPCRHPDARRYSYCSGDVYWKECCIPDPQLRMPLQNSRMNPSPTSPGDCVLSAPVKPFKASHSRQI